MPSHGLSYLLSKEIKTTNKQVKSAGLHGLLRLFLSIVLVCGASWLAAKVLAQCLSDNVGTKICTKARGADGKIHITYSINSGVFGVTEEGAIQAAINGWNAQSSTSGVVFELAPTGTTADLTFEFTLDASSATGTSGCARQDQFANRIYWGDDLQNRWPMGQAEVVAIFMHEIGHMLGLAHTSTATVMRQVAGQNCSTPAGATSVTQSDAQDVAHCIATSCTLQAPPRSGPSVAVTRSCTQEYTIEPIYNNEGDLVGYENRSMLTCTYTSSRS
jgi:hypothetical protein